LFLPICVLLRLLGSLGVRLGRRDAHQLAKPLSKLLLEGVDDHLIALRVLERLVHQLIPKRFLHFPLLLQVRLSIFMKLVQALLGPLAIHVYLLLHGQVLAHVIHFLHHIFFYYFFNVEASH